MFLHLDKLNINDLNLFTYKKLIDINQLYIFTFPNRVVLEFNLSCVKRLEIAQSIDIIQIIKYNVVLTPYKI